MTKKEMIAAAREVTLAAWAELVREKPHDLQIMAEARWGGAYDVLKAIGGRIYVDSSDAVPGIIGFEEEEK